MKETDEIANEYWAEARNSVLHLIRTGTATARGIKDALSDLTASHVSVTLTRLVQSGDIVRIRRGLYAPSPEGGQQR